MGLRDACPSTPADIHFRKHVHRVGGSPVASFIPNLLEGIRSLVIRNLPTWRR